MLLLRVSVSDSLRSAVTAEAGVGVVASLWLWLLCWRDGRGLCCLALLSSASMLSWLLLRLQPAMAVTRPGRHLGMLGRLDTFLDCGVFTFVLLPGGNSICTDIEIRGRSMGDGYT